MIQEFPHFLSLYFVGPKRSHKIPSKFSSNSPFKISKKKSPTKLLQARRKNVVHLQCRPYISNFFGCQCGAWRSNHYRFAIRVCHVCRMKVSPKKYQNEKRQKNEKETSQEQLTGLNLHSTVSNLSLALSPSFSLQIQSQHSYQLLIH